LNAGFETNENAHGDQPSDRVLYLHVKSEDLQTYTRYSHSDKQDSQGIVGPPKEDDR